MWWVLSCAGQCAPLLLFHIMLHGCEPVHPYGNYRSLLKLQDDLIDTPAINDGQKHHESLHALLHSWCSTEFDRSLKSLAFQHPAENDVLDHSKNVFHQIRVRCCCCKIIHISVRLFVPLQILPLYVLPERKQFGCGPRVNLTMLAQSHLVPRSQAGSRRVCGSSASPGTGRPC